MSSIVSYVHEAWFPMFLVAFFANIFVLWAILAIKAVKHGHRPFTGIMVVASIGVLLMMTPAGFAIWATLNLILWCVGLPPTMLFIAITLPASLLVGFWKTLVFDVIRPHKCDPRKGGLECPEN